MAADSNSSDLPGRGATKAVDRYALRVMVLDDEPFMLKVLVRMLASRGINDVSTFASAPAALAQIASLEHPPDLILCDLNMPEMDGIEFVRALVEQRYLGSLILMSGEDERVLQTAEKLVQAHHIRVLGHMKKPFVVDELVALIGKWSPPAPANPEATRRNYDAQELLAGIRNGELINHYQPKVNVASGRLVGVEALVRWMHPRDGMVMPDQFITAAEEHQLIDDLTRTVLSASLTQVKAWKQSLLALPVAVNVSMDNLSSLTFPDFVAAQVAGAGLSPLDLTLEVTESRLMRDLRAPLEILARLRLKGFRLSIDDFGTGHSSLAQLRDIPFDQLKLDRGFVHQAWNDKTVRAIYLTSLGVARQLEMEVVAEGVEDLDDWNFVRKTGCDVAQGYFIARPMPPGEIPAWIADWRARMQRELFAP